jgi:hypothetical protein
MLRQCTTEPRACPTKREPPSGQHVVSENAGTTEPARLRAVFVADENATLTVCDR